MFSLQKNHDSTSGAPTSPSSGRAGRSDDPTWPTVAASRRSGTATSATLQHQRMLPLLATLSADASAAERDTPTSRNVALTRHGKSRSNITNCASARTKWRCDITKCCACHEKRTYQHHHMLRRSRTGMLWDHYQLLRPPREVACQHHQMAPATKSDLPTNITKCFACHDKWRPTITKCFACHGKWRPNSTKCYACHEKSKKLTSSNITPATKRNASYVEHHQMFHLPREVGLQHHQMFRLLRKVTLRYHQMLRLLRKVVF